MTFPINPNLIGALLLAAAIAAPASAQDLKWGSKAPALSIEEWLKGKEIKAFQPGQIYVVEFWATWCPPCLRSIPHLTEVQKKYEASKVTVVGVASDERAKSVDDKRAGLVKFIGAKADTMAYTVAFDPDQSMSKTWMEPAGQDGIPTCFVVDGTGTLAWIGSPFDLDEPLAKIVSGKWDVKAEIANAEAKAKAEAEFEAKLQPIVDEASKAADAKDWDAAIKSLEAGLALGDEALRRLAWFKYNMHVEKKDFVGAAAFIDKNLKGALKDEAELLNAIAGSMIDPKQADRFTTKDYEFALRCAGRACEVVKGKHSEEPRMLDTLAAVHFAKGDAAKAVEVQTRAVELLKGQDGADELQKKLETYKKAAK